MLRQYFNCNERFEIFLTSFCNILCYVDTWSSQFEVWVCSYYFFRFCLLLLRSELSELSLLEKFWFCSNSGFVWSLSLFVFFGFGLLFLRSEFSERSLLGNFSVCSNSGFVQSLALFKVWLCSYFLHLVYFLRSERSERNLLVNFWVCSNSGFFYNQFTCSIIKILFQNSPSCFCF